MSELDWLDDVEERGLGATMTNREWVQSMETDRFAEFIAGCEYCNYCQACDNEKAVCKSAFKAWLEAEHEECFDKMFAEQED